MYGTPGNPQPVMLDCGHSPGEGVFTREMSDAFTIVDIYLRRKEDPLSANVPF